MLIDREKTRNRYVNENHTDMKRQVIDKEKKRGMMKGEGVREIERERRGWVFPWQKCEDSHSGVRRMSHILHPERLAHTRVQSGKSTVAKVTSD